MKKHKDNRGKNSQRGAQDDEKRLAYFPDRKREDPVLSELSDETLAAMVQDGDQRAFAEIVHRYARKCYGFAFKYVADREDAEDIVQTALMKFWQRPHMWDPERKTRFAAWFYRVVLNACRDTLRARKTVLPLFEEVVPAEMAESGEDALIKQDVLRALSRLPERQHQAILLCFYEGMSHAEAGDVMETTEKSVELLVRRAKAALKQMMEKEGGWR
ncbi:MAG: sigma-70 family RNA polymerase sigma factor [Alphaproteobacteria bacterium]|nr:MAG: sigma-70 family RNA polymerase sigma factor [Alphaproteobacteria bacterium]